MVKPFVQITAETQNGGGTNRVDVAGRSSYSRGSALGCRIWRTIDGRRDRADKGGDLRREPQPGVGPISPALSTPAASRPCVSAVRRLGVSQTGARAMSHARTPLAPAPTAIAPIMHCMHTPQG